MLGPHGLGKHQDLEPSSQTGLPGTINIALKTTLEGSSISPRNPSISSTEMMDNELKRTKEERTSLVEPSVGCATHSVSARYREGSLNAYLS